MTGERRLLTVAVLTIGLVLFLGSSEVFSAPPEGTLKQAIHWSLSADYLDPATCSNSKSAFLVLYLFHDTLVKAMPGGYYTPSLAESWSVSTDARLYEFRLRKGVKFHNGDPLTAEDVVFSFQRYKSAHAKLFHDRVEKMEAVNSSLFRLRFKEPFPDFFEYLLPGSTTLGWIVPKKYVQKVDPKHFEADDAVLIQSDSLLYLTLRKNLIVYFVQIENCIITAETIKSKILQKMHFIETHSSLFRT